MHGEFRPKRVLINFIGEQSKVRCAETNAVMRSSINFVMHPEDEAEFARKVESEAGIVFVDGPKWNQPQPPIAGEIGSAGQYLMIWNPLQTPELIGKHYRNEATEWWYCENEFLTIQFLRSGFQWGEPYLFEGRIAVSTRSDDSSDCYATSVERRFKALRNYIKKNYSNNKIIWQALSLPRSKTNPSKLNPCLWVGPHALDWLEHDPTQRWVQQFRGAGPRGYRVDLVK